VATARAVGFAALAKHQHTTPDNPIPDQAAGSTWVIAGAASDVARFAGTGWADPPPGPVLTDDFSDLLRALRLGHS